MIRRVYQIEKGKAVFIRSFEGTGMHCGFPSPAMDYIESKIDLNEILIKNPDSTFLANVCGPSMIDAGIADPSRLVIDRSVKAKNRDIIVAVVNGEFTVRKYLKKEKAVVLQPCNKHRPDIKAITITPDMEFSIWGVVIQVLVNPKEVVAHDSIS